MPRQTKTFKVKHLDTQGFHLGYILLPTGYAYNTEWQDWKKGDIIRMWDGPAYPIFTVRKVKLGSATADILSRMRYGITIKRTLQIWQSNAKLEGHGSKAVSEDECLWVVYGERDEQDSV